MRILIVAALAASLGGCSLFNTEGADFFKNVQDTAGKVDDAVTGTYAKVLHGTCEKVPQAARDAAFAHLNARPEMQGDRLVLDCARDR